METAKIKIVKLTSGEELIGEVDPGFSSASLTIHKPFVLFMADNRLMFMPFMPYSKASEYVELPRASVMFEVEPQDKLAEDYKQATSKILLPGKQSVLAPIR